MRNISILIIFLFIIASCDSNDPFSESGVDKDISFSYIKIEYYATNDSKSSISLDIPTIEYSNNGNIEQTYSCNLLDGQYETSHFVSEDAGAFIVEGIDLFVPIYVENSNISLGDKKWKYSKVVEKQESGLDMTKEIAIPPYKKVIINAKLFFRKYEVKYKLFLKEDKTRKEKVLEGVWTGIYPDYSEMVTSFTNL